MRVGILTAARDDRETERTIFQFQLNISDKKPPALEIRSLHRHEEQVQRWSLTIAVGFQLK